MEGLGVAANVIAVVELSAKIASLCIQYSRAVKHAKLDIERLREEVISFAELLRAVERLLQGPDNKRLSTSQKLRDALGDCFLQLTQLNKTLDSGKKKKIMSRFGVRAFKWPFERKEVDNVIKNLERCKQTVSLALQVDQTTLILDIHQKIDLSKLETARGASFDSHVDETDARCLPNTRVGLRQEIAGWAEDPHGRCIFWLNGMAGTGKSTISRTIAQHFADKGQLAGSFFFKRGEGDRGNAARFFTTIATQLTIQVPSLSPFIGNAIDADPTISEKSLKEQFQKLILRPLSKMQNVASQASRLVIVVDALDECDREEDVRTILLLLSQLRDVTSVCLRVFMTSRPELPIRLGFKNIKGDTFQDLVLHEISQVMIKHDISAFLQYELSKVRVDRSLNMDWPGQENIQALVEMAVPLFIFAATVCRFVSDPRWDPKKRLATILEYEMADQASKFDRTYLPILNQLLAGQDEVEQEKLAREFREVVGAIIVLANPLSSVSLATLLGIQQDDVACRLELLHSVLSIPTNKAHPVRLLHLSFRDFLLDPRKRGRSPFWVEETKTHERIACKCLQLMSKCLKKDICNLHGPGTLRSEIDSQSVDINLPAPVKYACRYWVYHLEKSKCCIHDSDQVHVFLYEHLLHWLEALSLLGDVSQSIRMITALLSILNAEKSPNLYAFVHDAKRFALYNRSVIEFAPLQLYSSSLVFAPDKSLVRRQFEKCIPPWIQRRPDVQANWGATLQTLEGHDGAVISVSFSHDSRLLASASGDKTIRVWEAATGSLQQTLKGHTNRVTSVAFSHESRLLASASWDKTVRVWEAATGSLQQTLEGHTDKVSSVAFSHDSRLLASASWDKTVHVWDVITGSLQQTLKGHARKVASVAFSHDSRLLASASWDKTVRVWEAATGSLQQTLKGHTNRVTSVAFSHESRLLASASWDKTVRIWDVGTGTLQQEHSYKVRLVAFSHDLKLLASGLIDNTVRVWDVATGSLQQTLEGHTDKVISVAFSHDSRLLASASWDKTVRVWDVATGSLQQMLERHARKVPSVALSYDSRGLASASWEGDSKDQVWDTATGSQQQTLGGHTDRVTLVAFSHDSKLLASASWDKTVRVWDVRTGSIQQIIESGSYIQKLLFDSSDSSLLTDTGRFEVDRIGFSPVPDPFQDRKSRDCHQGLGISNSWITWNTERLLWLPLDYRPASTDISRSTVAIGCSSGRVLIIAFSSAVLDSHLR
ncbi:MAG: hypothetical protein M1819_003327 [Sarea resinae]|nr:MAG: hypothetical protein M1819_003327 [Sarea resinae]